MRRDAFQAIADPTRRNILNLLANRQLNVNAITEQFDVSRTAIYKHMKILQQCGLIELKQQGRERYCRARLEKLGEVADWLEQYRQFWNQRLDALENYLAELQQQPAITPSPKKKK